MRFEPRRREGREGGKRGETLSSFFSSPLRVLRAFAVQVSCGGMMQVRRVGVAVLVLVAAGGVAVLPRVLTPDKRDVVIFMGLYTIVGAGLTLLMGFAGQVSL